MRWEVVLGTCKTDADCKKFARSQYDSIYCRKGTRCDPKVKRVLKKKGKKKRKKK